MVGISLFYNTLAYFQTSRHFAAALQTENTHMLISFIKALHCTSSLNTDLLSASSNWAKNIIWVLFEQVTVH